MVRQLSSAFFCCKVNKAQLGLKVYTVFLPTPKGIQQEVSLPATTPSGSDFKLILARYSFTDPLIFSALPCPKISKTCFSTSFGNSCSCSALIYSFILISCSLKNFCICGNIFLACLCRPFILFFSCGSK